MLLVSVLKRERNYRKGLKAGSSKGLFDELGSSPASMEAAKAVGAHGLIKGHAIQASDADQAYTRASLGDEVPGRGSFE